MTFEDFPKPIQTCLERIHSILAAQIEGASIQVLTQRPGDRINLALTVNDRPIAFNFVSEEECLLAFESDPQHCSPIDHFTENWIRVAQVKLKDNRSLADLSRHTISLLPHVHAPNPTA